MLNKIMVLLIHRKAISVRPDDELCVARGRFTVFLSPIPHTFQLLILMVTEISCIVARQRKLV